MIIGGTLGHITENLHVQREEERVAPKNIAFLLVTSMLKNVLQLQQ